MKSQTISKQNDLIVKVTIINFICLFASSLAHAQGFAKDEMIRSTRDYKNMSAESCLIKTPLYEGTCTHSSISIGDYSVNIHFYANTRRIISYVIDKPDYQGAKINGNVLKSKFVYIWNERGQHRVYNGICKEADKGIECTSEDFSYMSAIWQ